ncbi:glycoside hydrolase family 65 protein [Paenibacillus oleatilyticus]|uniref:glycoside hydrolase family 65 protein n=1 Tax=Paenibacillus oleatilyticus TaxID=2594886 RepID=UPI001C1F36A7|nr:glycosyl hydrolase family 65 protein [Paenibacillus oleatilyticus]MBU7318384.1 family 65 glycosyl hydrolase [Paenibacillus oleatilyticus]
MTWTLTNNELTPKALLNLESLFSLGNGYLGVRGNFEEGYRPEMVSIRGTYQNAFHDVIEIPYGEKLYAFPGTQQKLLNIIDAQTIKIYLSDDEEEFSVFAGEAVAYERRLHLDRGYSERTVHWRSPGGKEVKLHFRRVVSMTVRELFAIDLRIEPVNFTGRVKVVSTVNGDVSNFADPNDPRVASGHSKRLQVEEAGEKQGYVYAVDRTLASGLKTACVSRHSASGAAEVRSANGETVLTFHLTEPVRVTKWNVYTDTLRHRDNLVEQAIGIHEQLGGLTFEDLLDAQKTYLDDFWANADIHIEGDGSLQEGIRFNLYHLLQSVGRDEYSNISAKGLSGEGYEGHYFWDTEIYMFPVFLMTKPEIARQLLIYRYSTLDQARARAKEMGHKQGALFPWRTISGTECSSFFPSGTAQYHISGDIAYSYIQYYLGTQDDEFMKTYGAELLFETARLWLDMGHYLNGEFRIDNVTGPDEYTCVVNNNYYTNVMAKHNLKWAAKAYGLLAEIAPATLDRLCARLNVTKQEAEAWQQAAECIYLPYDPALNINPQDDTFLQKAVWDFENTPEEKYPLLLHYHPLTLYRYQVCKQADTVLAHFLLEDEQELETIRNSYTYYEKITTHDSSLSSCIFSIMASKLGYDAKAYDYFIETARLDLDNTHGNTKDGLHMANMGGTWMSIVYGFAGLRLKESGLSLAPAIPGQWDRYSFRLQYRGRKLAVDVDRQSIRLTLEAGEALTLKLYGDDVTLQHNRPLEQALKAN